MAGEGIKNSFRKGSSLTRLIYLNVGVYLLIKVIYVLFFLFGAATNFDQNVLNLIGLPAYWKFCLEEPWTLVTYMFTHFGFLHLLFNILWLYWFGSLFLKHFSQKDLSAVYVLGGLCGAALYLLCFNLLSSFEFSRFHTVAIGASASVMAIVFAVCFHMPQHRIYLFLIGPVKLIYLAVFTAGIDLLSIPSSNAGGHIAHLGGAVFGILFVWALRKGVRLTRPLTFLFEKIERLFSTGKKMKVNYKKHPSQMNEREYQEYKKSKDDRINDILDKISRSGYESLTKEEKEMLFKSGRS